MPDIHVDKANCNTGPHYILFESGDHAHPIVILTNYEMKRMMRKAWGQITKEMKEFILAGDK